MLRNCTKLDQAQRIERWWWFPGGDGWWLWRWCLCSWGLAWCLSLCRCSTCGCPSHANNWILQLETQKLGPRGPKGNTFSRTVEPSGLIGGWGSFWVGHLTSVGCRAGTLRAWVPALWPLSGASWIDLPLFYLWFVFNNCIRGLLLATSEYLYIGEWIKLCSKICIRATFQ